MSRISLHAPICHTGYGQAGYNLGVELSTMCDLTIFPMGQVGQFPKSDIINENLIANKECRSYISSSPSIKIWHQNDLFSHVSAELRIGFPIFELNRFSDLEKSSLFACDELYVCSKWAADIVEDQIGVDPTVIPLGVDTDIFRPSHISREGKTIFLNCGKWEVRKGHDILLNAFNRAFEPNDNVELWMMCDNIITPQVNEHWEKAYKTSKLGDKVKIIHYQESHRDVFNIMRQADCGVFPSRAEGWNLELLEMMACGKQVIATNYSAHTEYCNDENCMLIDIDSLESAYDGIWFNHQGLWAQVGETQIDQIVYNMRKVHQNKKNNGPSSIYNMGGVVTANSFTWKASASAIIYAIDNYLPF
jgi:glycosyltransferase involved in cell wall biosynthesis